MADGRRLALHLTKAIFCGTKSLCYMKKVTCFCFVSLLVLTALTQPKRPVPVIFDSDMGPDYDDVGALTLLHAFADSGYVRILASVASTRYEGVAGVFNVLNTYFGRPALPVGVPEGMAITDRDRQHWTDSLLANYPHAIIHNSEVPDAVTLYRRMLAAQRDTSVTIITVGFLTNLSNLLQSRPDAFSALNGTELVKKKVKRLVSMAGAFPSGKEYNVAMDAEAARRVFTQWPTPVLLSGFEIGSKIKTGLALVQNQHIRYSPVQEVFRISLPYAPEDNAGRMSWDQTAVFVAVKGATPFYTLRKGTIMVAGDGSNTWSDGDGRHAYLVENWPPQRMQAMIEKLMMHQPVKRKK